MRWKIRDEKYIFKIPDNCSKRTGILTEGSRHRQNPASLGFRRRQNQLP